ncbi:hypothetical protein PYW07_004454 [Mythimna separata]|uniref:Disease resistance R13L4/SHOC-2-like LRR domain-containing protein n=1 Tax=Mythimna separata TaxID=271217 RepID=A0AAD8DXP3_MYTSE|nr:hypothetical protein PYW07_004454 [Mythimna separata]
MRVTMTSKHLFVLLLALFAIALAQNEDDLHIPVENDNQFPPEKQPKSDGNVIEGSGAGAIDEPQEVATETEAPAPMLEDVQSKSSIDNVSIAAAEEHSCPKPCVCNIEGDPNKYIVDCSGYELTELPKPLDPKTTELNLQNNKLTEIPKEISDLKDLKILNAENNEIKEIVPGSISELPELVNLKLGNNRLIEFPQDLKNAFGLTKLEELDLGGNDMRTDLKPESFSNFKALRSLTLPTAAASIVEDLCTSFKESLVTVCTGACNIKSFECPEAPQPQGVEDELLDAILPGLIALGSAPEDNVDPVVKSPNEVLAENDTKNNEQQPTVANVETTETGTSANTDTEKAVQNTAILSKILKVPEERKPTDVDSSSASTVKPESEVIGATTSGTKTGGVDKSIIGMIVAGMVLVVAGITIKKNWSFIKNRFSSTPRNANERTNVTANGTTPEEVPLQEKSPV